VLYKNWQRCASRTQKPLQNLLLAPELSYQAAPAPELISKVFDWSVVCEK